MRMDTREFDVDKYLRASRRVDPSSVGWDRIGEHPVTKDEARCLAYMMDIETHTVVFLRDLLATRASFDPEVTAFLSCWAYEELWHGEAFSRFLGEAGYRVPPTYEDVAGDDAFPHPVRTQPVDQAEGRHEGVGLEHGDAARFPRSSATSSRAHDLGSRERARDVDGLSPDRRQDRAPDLDPAPPGDHQGRAAALRLLSDPGADAPREVAAGPHDRAVGDGAPVGARRNGRPAAGGDRPRDARSSATPTGWSR